MKKNRGYNENEPYIYDHGFPCQQPNQRYSVYDGKGGSQNFATWDAARAHLDQLMEDIEMKEKEETRKEKEETRKVVGKIKNLWKTVKPWIFATNSLRRFEYALKGGPLDQRQILFTWLFWTFLVAFILGALVSCKTLETAKNKTVQTFTKIGEELDTLGSSLVLHYYSKVEKEIERARVTLEYKARKEIDSFSWRIGLDKTKPKYSKEMKKEILHTVQAYKLLPSYQKIANPLVAGPYKKHKWKPDEETLKTYWERNPKTKGIHKAMQMTFIAGWSVGLDFLMYYGLRTCKEQKRLCKTGKSKICDCSKAQHVVGNAGDFTLMDGKEALFDNRTNTLVGLGNYAGVFVSLFCDLKKQRPEWKDLNIRWGGDWSSDFTPHNNSFRDLYHLEIRKGGKDVCKEGLFSA